MAVAVWRRFDPRIATSTSLEACADAFRPLAALCVDNVLEIDATQCGHRDAIPDDPRRRGLDASRAPVHLAVMVTAPEGEELVSAIVAQPDDDSLRLRYADWLEHRDAPRAELIRVQCSLAGQDVSDEERAELFQREAELLFRFGKLWAAAADLDIDGWIFERGFVERGNVYFERPAEAVLRTLKACPLRHVRDVSQLCDLHSLVETLPLLDRLTGLELGGLYSFDDTLLAKVLQSRHLQNLSTLIVHHDRNGNLADEQVIVDSLTSPHRSNIEVLGIQIDGSWRGPSNRILASIADSPYLRRLERLHIPCAGHEGRGPRLDVTTVRRLAESPNLHRLQALDLRNLQAGTDVWEAIVEMPVMRRLRVLYLAGAFEIDRSGRPQKLRDNPRWVEAFEERVAEVDWSWNSTRIGDGTWPADPVQRRRDEMRKAIFSRPPSARPRRNAVTKPTPAVRPSTRKLPLLATRGAIVFPDAVERLVIGRPRSLMAIDTAIEQGGELVVASQKISEGSESASDDIHRIGTLCSIADATPLPDGTRSVLIVGRCRVRIEHLEPSDDVGFIADVEEIDEPAEGGASVDVLMAGLRAFVAGLPEDRMPAETVDLVQTTFDPRLLTDAISGTIRELAADRSADFAARQELLETTDPKARLERLRELLTLAEPSRTA